MSLLTDRGRFFCVRGRGAAAREREERVTGGCGDGVGARIGDAAVDVDWGRGPAEVKAAAAAAAVAGRDGKMRDWVTGGGACVGWCDVVRGGWWLRDDVAVIVGAIGPGANCGWIGMAPDGAGG